ncbi:preprotein translocase subunit YajC [Agromyces sp. H3Y2-19a]|jgi:preprotein translocase subunit YajC|uniref:preprotein translocase subunit YajC n=1 Tax=Agromyces TaxID=33877 RepID=UPI001E3D2C6A|nr:MULTISPECIES: preprotein translocase subunit YajC [Agromyces]MCD5347009.1 preprotein translocase subunit YajC [Agromyces sp. S2-1-8]MDF0515198.1 preprotein translocase subunit YajC [Agromyces chromiiresistens]
MTFDPITIIMLAVLAVLIFFMFRNSRKRQADAKEMQSKVQPGAQVMTNFGVFGTILSIDEDENQVLLETSPGTILTVHRQTIARVVEPTAVADESATTDDGEPEFGERVSEAPADETPSDTSGTDQSNTDETPDTK